MQQVFEALAPRQSVDPKVASIQRGNAPQAMLMGQPEKRGIGKIHWQISRADPPSSGTLRPPSDTHSRTRGAISAGIKWQTSVRTGQVVTKAPLWFWKKEAQPPWS
jgi:hypothetical protein